MIGRENEQRGRISDIALASKLGAITELEKIKTETKDAYETNKFFGVEEYNAFVEIIDKHIAELESDYERMQKIS